MQIICCSILSKICFLSLSCNRNDQDLENSNLKFLGLLFDCRLTWNPHVDFVSKKMAKDLYILRKLRNTVDNYIFLTVYFSDFQSIFSYGIVLWGSCINCITLFILQTGAVRLIRYVTNLASCKPVFVQLRVLTLYSQYVFHWLCFVHSNLELFSINADFH